MNKQTISRVLAVACLAGLMTAGLAQAQGDPYLELLRSDVQADKTAIMTEGMMLTTEQGDVFWPIYREFQLETSKLGDRLVVGVKLYAENYDAMTDDVASQISKEWFAVQNDRLSLLKKTHDKVAKALGQGVAARFVQLENAVQMLINVQVAAEMPLFPDSVPAEKK